MVRQRWTGPGRPTALFARRLVQLYLGLCLYGVSMSLQVRAGLGLDPWDVLHQGLAQRLGVRFGTITIIVGVAVLLLWIPLRQRPGLGTVNNVVVIGVVVNLTLDVLPAPGPLALRWAFLVAAVLGNGVATGCYIGAGLGPGPRDGLMTGLAGRGHPIRLVRTGIEATVLLIGFLLGGTVGLGTVLYAVSIGPLAHVFIPAMTIRPRPGTPPAGSGSTTPATTAGTTVANAVDGPGVGGTRGRSSTGAATAVAVPARSPDRRIRWRGQRRGARDR